MRVAELGNTSLPVLVEAITRAFAGYFVRVSDDVAYWEHRFHCANADLRRSYGVFDGDVLVAFIIQGFGTPDGIATAFNSGTGVLPAYRGRGLVDRLYAHARPLLREEGIACCALEVIQQNERAIRVYERIGFKRVHAWRCFKGELAAPDGTVPLERVPVEDLRDALRADDHLYSWDHRLAAIERSDGRWAAYVPADDPRSGHVVLDASEGRIARLNVRDGNDLGAWRSLLAAVAGITREATLVNVHPERTALISALLAAGHTNHVDQFEMRMPLPR